MKNDIIKKHLLNQSDRLFLMDEKTQSSETYRSFFDAACTIGGFLQSEGLHKGDRIVVMMDNSILLAKIYFACLYAGVVVVPINPSTTAEQTAYIIEHSQPRLVLTSESYSQAFQNDKLRKIIFNEEAIAKLVSYSKINPLDRLDLLNTAIIIYTSGTTSHPKGVIHTVSDLVGNGLLFVKSMGITSKNRFFNMLPMTYLGGYYNLLLIPYLAEASVVIAGAFSPQTIMHFWNNVIKHEVNTLWLVPTIMAILMEIDRSENSRKYSQKHIILGLVGTAPLSSSLKQKFEDYYGFKTYENYGLSETLFITSHLPGIPTKGVGKILEGVHLKIVDKQGNAVVTGEEGEVVVETPYVMNHYLGIENSFTKNKDQWFLTGDVGYVDQENNLFITGRIKDLIIKGGVNISPAAIEEVISELPMIKDCAVVGVPHALSGEEVIAVIKLDTEENFSEIKKDILNHCRKKLSPVQVPADVIKIDELPRTFTGKIQKAKLRAWIVEGKNAKTKAKEPQEKFFKPSHVVSTAIPALSVAYNNMVYELQSQNMDVTVLSLGEAFFDLPLYDFSKLPFPASYHYSHSRGIPKLRTVLSDYFQEQYDVKFNPDSEIILTAGSKIAIYMTLMALVNPGDEVLIPEPAWVSYPEQVKLCHGIPVSIPYYESVYDYEKYITNRTKVLIVNNPNNPRGSVFSLDEIAHLYKLAEKYHLYILSDEAYSDFVVNKEEFISIGNFDKDLKFSVICNSISKNFGISGWRIGYVIANKELISQILKLNQHLITCPATILEHYIAEHFYDILKVTKPQILTLLDKRKKVIEYMNKIGLTALEGETTFYHFVSIEPSMLTSDEFCRKLLNENRICVVPGIGYGVSCDKFVRMSIGTESLDRIFIALDKMKALIQKTQKSKSVVSVTQKQVDLVEN